MAAAEPSAEPPAAAGAAALLRAAAETALTPVRALLADQGILPQQALGVLNFVAEVLSRILLNLAEPEALAKFSRLKLSALRKKVAQKPQHAEAALCAAGFTVAAADPEHLEWGPESPGALAAALSMQAIIAQVQERAQSKGVRALNDPLDADCANLRAVLSNSFAGAHLLEPRMPGREAWMIPRAWLREQLPPLAKALEELPSLFEPTALFTARERNAKAAVHRAICEARGQAAKLVYSPVLGELAQLAAGAELVRLRKPEMFRPLAPQEPEAEGEPEEALPSVGAAELIVPALLQCVPAFRLGLPHGAMSDILRLTESPAFFTADLKDKAFLDSVAALGRRLVNSWLERPVNAEALLREEACVVGIGCSLDIAADDKAIVFVVVA